MDLIDLEDDQIDAEVLDALAVTQEDFRVCDVICFSPVSLIAISHVFHLHIDG